MISLSKSRQGFTLIELLTVIAIIGILAGLIAAGLPRALMAAKKARLENTFLQIRNILTEYMVDHGTFPPAYGYLDRDAVKFISSEGGNIASMSFAELQDLQTGNPFGLPTPLRPVYTRPWMAFVGKHNIEDLYDDFSVAYNTDRDDDISRLEYAPFGRIRDAASQSYNFPTAIYHPDNVYTSLTGDLQRQFDSQDRRPIIYIPVNKRQVLKVARVWFNFAQDSANPDNPRPNDAEEVNRTLSQMAFPPPSYDAYVLISVGPNINTGGIIYDFAGPLLDQIEYSPAYYYHVLGMATYFMATRDAERRGEGDGELDFDYTARTTRGQVDSPGNYLPGPNRNAPGPIIFVGEG